MPRRRILATLLGSLIGTSLPALDNAAKLEATKTQTLILDAARSSADFEVKVLWLIGVHGRFRRGTRQHRHRSFSR